NHDRHRRPHSHSPPARPSARGPEEIQPPGKVAPVEGRAPSPVQAERSSATVCALGKSGFAIGYFRCPTIACPLLLAEDYNSGSESLQNPAHQGRHEVHLHAL